MEGVDFLKLEAEAATNSRLPDTLAYRQKDRWTDKEPDTYVDRQEDRHIHVQRNGVRERYGRRDKERGDGAD